jgi:hypothetical protein
MKDILKEYIDLFLEAINKFPINLTDFAKEIGGKYETKYGAHIRFEGTPDALRDAVGMDESIIIEPSSGNPLQRSGKYPTYIFDFTDKSFKLPRGGVIKTVPIVLINYSEKDFLASGKMLGYGAEHAVYASLKRLPRRSMIANIKNDTRLKNALKGSNQQYIDNFIANCKSMVFAFGEKIEEMGLSGLKTNSSPPSGGNAAVDVPAYLDSINYNIHVKYQSDRLVGLQLPKIQKDEDLQDFSARLQKHPNKIYRDVRDGMIGELQKSTRKLYDIYDIFMDKNLREDFYGRMTTINGGAFPKEISDALKGQLGYSSTSSDVSLFVNFENPETVNIKQISGASSTNFEFILRIPPSEKDQKISRAFVIDAVVRLPKGPGLLSKKNVENVFYLEVGSVRRNRGLDVHKGENYQKFVETIENLSAQ